MTTPDDARDLLTAADPVRGFGDDARQSFALVDVGALRDLARSSPSDLADVPRPGARRRGLGRRTAVAVGALAVVAAGGTAAAVGLLTGPSPEASGTMCRVGDVDTVMPPSARSPIEQCRDQYDREGIAAPDDLVAYQSGGMMVFVSSRAKGIPDDARIVTDYRPDVRLLELRSVLSDRATGYEGPQERACLSRDDVRHGIEAHLDRLGLTNVTLRDETTEPGAGDDCVTARIGDTSADVVLEHRQFRPARPRPDVPARFQHDEDFQAEVARERRALEARGASGEELAAMVRAAAQRHQVSADLYPVEIVPTPVGDRARLYTDETRFVIYAPDGP